MSGTSTLPPIQLRIDGAQTAQQAIDGLVAASDRLGAAGGTEDGDQVGVDGAVKNALEPLGGRWAACNADLALYTRA